MAEEAFMLMSLKESKAKRLAQVIGNDTSRRILDYLAREEGTESEIADKLAIPLSTVHYNLKHLVNSGLVLAEEFHYSTKGREIVHYKLANKLIIIAPKEADRTSIMDSLKTILPITALIAGGAFLTKIFGSSATMGTNKVMADAANIVPLVAPQTEVGVATSSAAGEAVASMAESAVADTAVTGATESAKAMASSPDGIVKATHTAADLSNSAISSSGFPPWGWFLIGAIFATLAIVIVVLIRKRQKG